MKLTPYQAYHQNQPEEEPRIARKTLKQLSQETGLNVKLLNKRSWKLGIKGICLGNDGTKYYTEAQIERIVNYLKPPKKTGSVKITVIELFQNGMNGRYIAQYMKISTVIAYDAIKEYNESGCITVESRVNFI